MSDANQDINVDATLLRTEQTKLKAAYQSPDNRIFDDLTKYTFLKAIPLSAFACEHVDECLSCIKTSFRAAGMAVLRLSYEWELQLDDVKQYLTTLPKSHSFIYELQAKSNGVCQFAKCFSDATSEATAFYEESVALSTNNKPMLGADDVSAALSAFLADLCASASTAENKKFFTDGIFNAPVLIDNPETAKAGESCNRSNTYIMRNMTALLWTMNTDGTTTVITNYGGNVVVVASITKQYHPEIVELAQADLTNDDAALMVVQNSLMPLDKLNMRGVGITLVSPPSLIGF